MYLASFVTQKMSF